MSHKFVILAALDLNAGSTPVLEKSVELAAGRPGCELHVVTVSEPELPPAFHPALIGTDPPAPAATDSASQFCREFVANRRRIDPSESLPPIRVHSTVGRAADEIIWLAAHVDADVIVMSTHGRRGLKRIMLGSVAEKVVRLAGCPVFVVRAKTHNADWRVPEIEPVCPDCAVKRGQTNGAELWCARHAEHHVRAHVLHYTGVGDAPPLAWSSSTGT